MDWSCATTVDAGVFLSPAVSCCTPCSTLYSSGTDGRISYDALIQWYQIPSLSWHP